MTDHTETAPAEPAAELTPHEALSKLWDWVNANASSITEEGIGKLTALEDVLRRGLDGVAVAEQQRNFLGGHVSNWIGRYYGLKVANGELAPGALPQIVANEVGALEQACGQIAREAQRQ